MSNASVADVTVDSCAIAAPAGDFSVTACPASVPAGGTATATVRFAPQVRGADSITFGITYAAGALSATTTVNGRGIAPDMVVTVLPDPGGTPIDFGEALAGSASATTYTFRVANTGDGLLDATLSESGTNRSDWTYAPLATSFTVAAGESRDIVATFTPSAAGSRTASVTFADVDALSTDPTATFALTGSGTGAAGLTLSPLALTFGSIDVQSGAQPVRTLTIGNIGNLPLEITALRLEALDGSPYGGDAYLLSSAAPLTIAPGEQVQVDVTYRPVVESAGDYAVLVLETDSPQAPEVEITLSGRGLDRHIAVSDPTIDFPDTYRNPPEPAAVPLEISNTGESPLVIDAIVLESDAFSLAGELPDQIPPLGSATIEVRFAPPAAGPITGSLLLVNDDDQRPMLRVDLAGAGILPPITASVEAIDFGSATSDLEVESPGERFITLVNRSEVDTFTVKGAQVAGPDGQVLDGFDFYGLRHPIVLEPGAEMLLEVVFHPHRGGDFGGTLELLVDEDPLGVPVVVIEAEAVDGSLRGSGCSAGGPSGALGALVLLVAVLGLRRRVAAAVLALALAPGAAAFAQVEPERQTRDLDIATFRPVHTIETSMLTVESSAVGQHGAFAFDAWIDYAHNPLVVETAGGDMVDHPIASRATLELAGAYAFGGRFEVAGVVPIVSQAGSDPQFSGIAAADGSALGDLRLRGKAFLLAVRPFAFGTSAEITLPTATGDDFAGAHGPSAALRLLADYSTGPIDVAANAGALMRQKAQLADVEQGHQFVYGLGAAYRFTPQIAAIGELFGAIDIGGGPAGGKPLEVVGGGRYRINRAWAVVGGVGRGLLPGIGSPDVRVFAAVSFAPRAQPPAATAEERLARVGGDDAAEDKRDEPDADGDGVGDRFDRCADRPEDKDGFEDADGCPEADNDRDNLVDSKDRCPDQPEDADGYADDDGCPDPDNDRDGVFDAQDQCPTKPETINGNSDDDGCPDKGESLVFVTKDRIELFAPIKFKGDTAELARDSGKLLGQVGATLRANPDIVKLHIRAHVDRRGKDDDALSVRRAETVRKWLVEWGIASERLEGVGFGSRFPLGKGRALNDRIELEIKQREEAPR